MSRQPPLTAISKLLTVVLLCGSLVSPGARAGMVLDRTILQFATGDPIRQDVTVSNPDEAPLYLQVEVLQVTAPGTDDEKRTVVTNPEEIGLIATPHRLVVPPGGRRPVRIVNLNGHGDAERVYRVNITPVPPPADVEGMGVRVLIAYQLLVFVAPENTRVKLETSRSEDRLMLTNSGNVNVLLRGGKHCSRPVGDDCQPIPARRLYPGNTLELNIPAGRAVTIESNAAGERRKLTF